MKAGEMDESQSLKNSVYFGQICFKNQSDNAIKKLFQSLCKYPASYPDNNDIEDHKIMSESFKNIIQLKDYQADALMVKTACLICPDPAGNGLNTITDKVFTM